MQKRAIIFDLENTLYNWAEYIVNLYESLVKLFTKLLNINPEEVIDALKNFAIENGTLDYVYIFHKFPLLKETENPTETFKLVKKVFDDNRRKYLKIYEGVDKVLSELRNSGILILGFTNSPSFPIEQCVKYLGIDVYFDTIYTIKNDKLPTSIDPVIKSRIKSGYFKSRCDIRELPEDYAKPNPNGIYIVIEDNGLEKEEVLIVGDSLEHDILMAKLADVDSIWAKYGWDIPASIKEKMRKYIAPVISLPPDFIKENVNDLLSIAPSTAINSIYQLLNTVKL